MATTPNPNSTETSPPTDTKYGFENPVVLSFSIVGILFVLSVILGIINVYICHAEKRKKRGFNTVFVTKDNVTSSRGGNVSRTHLAIHMTRGNAGSSPPLTRQKPVGKK